MSTNDAKIESIKFEIEAEALVDALRELELFCVQKAEEKENESKKDFRATYDSTSSTKKLAAAEESAKQDLLRSARKLRLDAFDAKIWASNAQKVPTKKWVLSLPQMRWLFQPLAPESIQNDIRQRGSVDPT